MKTPHVTLDQWRSLIAVVDEGSFVRAAEVLHRSQSSVSYAIARLQEQLGIALFGTEGRRARLTDAGESLARRARELVNDALRLEDFAHALEQGWEAEIRLVVDVAFPTGLLMEALRRFAPQSRGTRVQLREEVLSGVEEALTAGEADLAICHNVPDAFLGDPLLDIEFVAVTHPEHPLQKLGRSLDTDDLRSQIQVVIRDSGSRHQIDRGWLGAAQRWTVTGIDTAVVAVSHGLGFAWLPRHHIEAQLADGRLRALPLRQGGSYVSPVYLVQGCAAQVGPATALLTRILHEVVTDPHHGTTDDPRNRS